MAAGDLVRRLFKVHKLLSLPERLWSLDHKVAVLERIIEGQRQELLRQIDISRSALEVPEDVVDDFHRFRATFVPPANPLISVCIVTYNRAQLLSTRAIPSVLNQTYRNFELIIVGDCCTDDTAERVAAFKDNRIRFVNLSERGIYPEDPNRRWLVAGCHPFNEALRMTSGDFITHLDDDDEHLPTRLATLLEFCLQSGCDVAWHPFWWERPDGQWALNDADTCSMGKVTTGSMFYSRWFKRIEGNMKAYRTLEPGDWNRMRRMLYVGAKASRCPEPLLRHYRERQQSAAAATLARV